VVETGRRTGRPKGDERALLVGVLFAGDPDMHEHPLDELERLADTAGCASVGRVVQRRRKPDASTFVGQGKAGEIAAACREHDAEVAIFNVDLSPAQIRNLEKVLETRVVDRTELILDIFALHARSHQARLQVEMAQAQYLLPRLRRMWTHLSREGGTGQAGGVGTRGPGEKQIEIDRRLLRRRMGELKGELARIGARRLRMARARDRYFTISLVGYTNAGKSTLLQRLTGDETFIADQLFATLDTKTRAWELPGGKHVFLSDTVGFIRNLPHHLVESFRATLEEARAADLILHVVDVSHPDAKLHIESVNKVLKELDTFETPRLLVLNKADRVEDPLDLRLLGNRKSPSVVVSALTGEGVDQLAAEVERFILEGQTEAEYRIPAGDGKVLAFLADRGTILDRSYDDGVVALRVRLARADVARVDRMINPVPGKKCTDAADDDD
jgi:GTP-binding protein HflX